MEVSSLPALARRRCTLAIAFPELRCVVPLGHFGGLTPIKEYHADEESLAAGIGAMVPRTVRTALAVGLFSAQLRLTERLGCHVFPQTLLMD